jgi:dipeptidase E
MKGLGAIVAIGGGDLRSGETRKIDETVVRLTGKERPNALFIPTALRDQAEYIESFEVAYGRGLGCKTDVLRLVTERPSRPEIQTRVDEADLVYVGGGSTLNLIRIWRRVGLDVMLRDARERGLVLSGLSAGANCWFRYAHSDSKKFWKNPGNGYMRVSCLGFEMGTYCPHVLGENRLEGFREMMRKYRGTGYAVDNLGAIVVIDGKVGALRCETNVFVKKLVWSRGTLAETDVEETSIPGL